MKKINIQVLTFILLLPLVGLTWAQLKKDTPKPSIVEEIESIAQVRPYRVEKSKPFIRIYGEGKVRASKRAFLNFEVSGKINSIGQEVDGSPLREGAYVEGPKKGERLGQLIASLDDREERALLESAKLGLSDAEQNLINAANDLADAKRNLDYQKKIFKRSEDLLGEKVETMEVFEANQLAYENAVSALEVAKVSETLAQSQLKRAKVGVDQAMLTLEKTRIAAPFGGVIARLNIKENDLISPAVLDLSSEETLFNQSSVVLLGNQEYEISIKLKASEGRMVRRDMEVSIYHPISESILSKGKVFSVTPFISPLGRNMTIKVRTHEGLDVLQEGMLVICEILIQEEEESLLVPLQSLNFNEPDTEVFVIHPDTQRVMRRKVKTGTQNRDSIQVVSGLEEGELIVTFGKHKLYENCKVEFLGNYEVY